MQYYERLIIMLFLLIAFISINIKPLYSYNQDVILHFKTLHDETPFNDFLSLKIYNETFKDFYQIIDGKVQIPYELSGLNVSVIWNPFNKTIMDLGRIDVINLSKPIKLNIVNIRLRCDPANIDLYLNISDENKIQIWRMYEGMFNLTIPTGVPVKYTILYSFFKENFTVSSGVINVEKELPLKLDVIDIRNTEIKLNKSVSNVVIKLIYKDKDLFLGMTGKNGALVINSSQTLPVSIEGCYWQALYEGKEVGRLMFNAAEKNVFLDIGEPYIVSLLLVDYDDEKIDFAKAEIYLNETRLENPIVQLGKGYYIPTIKLNGHDISSNMTKGILVNRDGNISLKCDARRLRGITAKWLIGISNGEPVFLRYTDDMLVPFGIFTIYTEDSLIGYLNNSRSGLKVTKLSARSIVEYKPGIALNITLLIIVQVFFIMLANIILIKWHKSKR